MTISESSLKILITIDKKDIIQIYQKNIRQKAYILRLQDKILKYQKI